MGYETLNTHLILSKDTSITIKLNPALMSLQEVIINERFGLTGSAISTIRIPMSLITKIPSLMGEADILKALQFLPGVNAGTEGTGGLYVRGGSPDQTMILLDGVVVYNPDHLFGFVSVFNPDAIKNVILIKGGFPARYGGRLSSIVDIAMKEGDMNKPHLDCSINPISSKIMVQGPIIKDKSSYLISARRTWLDMIFKNFLNYKDIPIYNFYDLTTKFNLNLSAKNRFYLSFYSGRDKIHGINTHSEIVKDNIKLNNNEDQYFGWGNITSNLRWNHVCDNKVFINTSLTFSNYKYYDDKNISNFETNLNTGEIKTENYNSTFHSGIQDLSVKSDFDYQLNEPHNLRFGAGVTYHYFTPNASINQVYKTADSLQEETDIYNIKALESSVYFEDELKLNSKLNLDVGLRLTGFLVENKYYTSLEPRLSTRIQITDNSRIEFAYSRMNQYINLLTSSRVTFSTDLWVPSTSKIKPQLSDQFSAGTVITINKQLNFSIEVYYKTMRNIIEYSEGSSFLDNSNWENKVETNGIGRVCGAEFLLQKISGKTTGWIGYTLARSQRKFENISFGEWYPYKYDQRHNITILINRELNKNIDAGLTWEFNSGNMFTVISQVYEPYPNPYRNPNYWIQYFKNRNNYRLPAYHRMDLNINFHRQRKYFERTWSINIYNVYNRMNTFFVYYGNDDEHGRKDLLILKKYTLFPILPSVSYSIKF